MKQLSKNDHLLQQGMKHQLPHYRLVAATLAGRRKRSDLRQDLIALTVDPSPLVREAAIIALHKCRKKVLK